MSSGLIYHFVKTKDDVLIFVMQNVPESYRREIPKAYENVGDPLIRFCVVARSYEKVVGANFEATLLVYRKTKAPSPTRNQEAVAVIGCVKKVNEHESGNSKIVWSN
jgi:hypothetical protein